MLKGIQESLRDIEQMSEREVETYLQGFKNVLENLESPLKAYFLDNKFLVNPDFHDVFKAAAPKSHAVFKEDYVNFNGMYYSFIRIEELKNELSIIMITQTTAGRDRWDTPEVKLAAGRKDRLRKDRYSALSGPCF